MGGWKIHTSSVTILVRVSIPPVANAPSQRVAISCACGSSIHVPPQEGAVLPSLWPSVVGRVRRRAVTAERMERRVCILA